MRGLRNDIDDIVEFDSNASRYCVESIYARTLHTVNFSLHFSWAWSNATDVPEGPLHLSVAHHLDCLKGGSLACLYLQMYRTRVNLSKELDFY